MGFVSKVVKKVTGVQDQINAQNANAKAQVDATDEASQAQQAALAASAQAAAQQTAATAARTAAEQQASDIASTAVQTSSVQLSQNSTNGTSADDATRRAKFGRNYTGGASI